MRIRFTVTLLIALFAVAIATAVAIAHTDIKSTNPPRGGKAKTSIRTVSVTFAGQIRRGTLRVTGPGNRVVSNGKGGRDPRNVKRLLVALNGSLKPGKYSARWSMVAADGHAQHGSFGFRLRR
jgi:methionine-rich copper-binding protein CopC